ncbi:sigma 54-interacting transcriptional regulator [Clostridiaceae bacterium M8S5]|nr:sigma 54-interacting transcriptional regulator [Clostridiaceae bacterium M8S5]
MKSIAVVTDGINTRLESFLKGNLELVFKGYININSYYFKDLKEGDMIKDDVVLVMIEERALRVQKHVLDSKKVVVINRTIKEKEIYKIFSLPRNMDILVVNDNMHTTLDMVSLLYQLGVNHLNLIPYNENNIYSNIKIAVTPSECEKVPSFIEEIIDVGHRCIDISTFIKIINKLSIDNKEISKRLIIYSDQVVSIDSGVKNKYKELYIKNEELDTVINLSKNGIMLASEDGVITVHNKSLLRIFDIKQDMVGQNIKDLFKEGLEKLIYKEDLIDEVFEFENKYINVNKKTIVNFGQKTGMYFNIQEITYIKQMEQNLSKKLREKGQIARYTFDDIKTVSDNMNQSIKLASKISKSELTVLITGESGTGKEVFAQSIHNASNRCNQPFIAVNCAAMPENLLESELFGYKGGAFTGALKEGKKGLFEQANNGSIFLDEIGDMPIHLQTKLLRVLQEKQVMRIGSDKVMDIDVRIIAATNRNLTHRINAGEFRPDLFYRLNVLPINIPPLRQRKKDIILFLIHFLKEKYEICDEARVTLFSYDWPGNIRELKNVAAYISTMCENNIVTMKDLPFYLLNINENFDYELQVLDSRKCTNKAINIIEIIKSFNNANKAVGRINITRAFKKIDASVTEGEVRKILSILNDIGLVSSNIGRKGSSVTDKGKRFLTYIDNKMSDTI